MDWILPFPAPSVGRSPIANLPTGLVRKLLADCAVPFGARVLDIGPVSRRLEQQLLYLGCKSTSLDTTDSAGTPPLLRKLPEQAFDLVLMREETTRQHDLLQATALDATAHLLAALRPRGHLILLNRREATWEAAPDGHLQSCYARHLGCFGASPQVYRVHDGAADWRTWSWLAGLQPRSGYVISRLTIDGTPRQRGAWRQLAADREQHPSEFCCLWARQIVGQAPVAVPQIASPAVRRAA